jgi:hypothetical protein
MMMDRLLASFLTAEREDYIGRVSLSTEVILEIGRTPSRVKTTHVRVSRSADSRSESATLLAIKKGVTATDSHAI